MKNNLRQCIEVTLNELQDETIRNHAWNGDLFVTDDDKYCQKEAVDAILLVIRGVVKKHGLRSSHQFSYVDGYNQCRADMLEALGEDGE